MSDFFLWGVGFFGILSRHHILSLYQLFVHPVMQCFEFELFLEMISPVHQNIHLS